MELIYILHIIICVLLVLTILFQDGKTGGLTGVADASQQNFTARSATNFLTKLTTYLAIFFMVTSLSLAILSTPSNQSIASDYDVSTTDNGATATSDEPAPVETEAAIPETAAGEANDATARTEPVASETQQPPPDAAAVVVDEDGNKKYLTLSEAVDSTETVDIAEVPDEVFDLHIKDLRAKGMNDQAEAAIKAREEAKKKKAEEPNQEK